SMTRILFLLNLGFWAIFWVWFGATVEPISALPTGDSRDAEQFYVTPESYLPSAPGTFESLPMKALRWVQLPSLSLGLFIIREFRTDDFVLGVSVFTWRL